MGKSQIMYEKMELLSQGEGERPSLNCLSACSLGTDPIGSHNSEYTLFYLREQSVVTQECAPIILLLPN